MPRPKQVTDKELLNTALECFLKHGPNVSTQIIADKVGLSQPALFKRFGTKKELFLRAVVPSEDLPVLDWINSSPIPGPFRPQFEQLLINVLDTLTWVLPRIQLLQAARIPRKVVMARYKTPPPIMLTRSIAGFFKRAEQMGYLRNNLNPLFLAQSVFGVLMGRSFQNQIANHKVTSKDDSAFIESTVKFLCKGIVNDSD
ncbi:MAG: TetR/AcrR family transcriptional regulator [Candidatus Aegiribacteria sp.]|nr:TetR/AcrR family transcriptional regulator [Candidatus Aegiribacteria sp.]